MSAAKILPAVAALALLGLPAGGGLASESAPGERTGASSSPAARRVVESFHAVLSDCMVRSDELGFDGRFQRIAESQDRTFDVPAIARTSIFRGWKRLREEDRSRWIALSRRYWASRYAHEYASFSGQSFETLDVAPAPDEGATVHARLTPPDGDDVELAYHLRAVDGAWRIVDFRVSGRSEVRQLREFNYAVLERRGFEALVSEIEGKIAQLQRK